MDARRVTAQDYLDSAKRYGLFAGFVGLCLGILYSFGGLILDAATTGLNAGTALAMFALVGMPLIMLPVGVVAGLLWTPISHRIPRRYGGSAPDDIE